MSGHRERSELIGLARWILYYLQDSCELHRTQKVPWRALLKLQITWGRNHFNASMVSYISQNLTRLIAKSFEDGRKKKENLHSIVSIVWSLPFTLPQSCSLTFCPIFHKYKKVKKKSICYCISHLYNIVLKTCLSHKADFIMVFSFLKYYLPAACFTINSIYTKYLSHHWPLVNNMFCY